MVTREQLINNSRNKFKQSGDIETIDKNKLSLSDKVKLENDLKILNDTRKKVANEIETTLKQFNSKEDYIKSFNDVPEEYKKHMTISV